jgi:mono/diheme cytochrome c family protein
MFSFSSSAIDFTEIKMTFHFLKILYLLNIKTMSQIKHISKPYSVAMGLIICILWMAGCDQKSASDSSQKPVVTLDGEKIFRQNCVVCHGADGKLGANGSKDLTLSELSSDERFAIISKGKGVMTAFESILTVSEIKAVADYTLSLKDMAK